MILESHLNVFDKTLTTSEQEGTSVVFGEAFKDDGHDVPESRHTLANSGVKLRVMVTTATTGVATVKLVGKDKSSDGSYTELASYPIPVSVAGKIYDFVLPENALNVLNVKVTGGTAVGRLNIMFVAMSRGY